MSVRKNFENWYQQTYDETPTDEDWREWYYRNSPDVSEFISRQVARLHRRALYIGLAIIAAVIAAGFYISLWRH